MVQWIKHWLHKYGESSDPQHQRKYQAHMVATYNHSTQEEGGRGSPEQDDRPD